MAARRNQGAGVHQRMKKLALFFCLLPALTLLGRAQEMRQDVSLSGMLTIQQYVEGSAPNNVRAKATLGPGMLLSYRFQLTPNGAIEANYSYSRYTEKFTDSQYEYPTIQYVRVLTSVQEATFGYVRTIPFKKFNPFVEAGGGMLFFSPLGGIKTTAYDTEMEESLMGFLGGGIAYELSTRWDLRMAYRGYVAHPQTFGLKQFDTGRYEIISQPFIGFAYHF
jgi:outer membrane immunogenic protein